MKSSLQVELDSFFCNCFNHRSLFRYVTKAAFCKARKKFNHSAFQELNCHAVDSFTTHFPQRNWHGFRVLAFDGSTLKVPSNEETSAHFGVQPNAPSSGRPMARVSHVYDLLNRMTLHAVIQPYHLGERELAMQHQPVLQKNDLILMDRGYPAFWFLAWLLEQPVDFCVRMPLQQWKSIQTFCTSKKQEDWIFLTPCAASKKKCKDYNLPQTPIRVRVMRISTDGGEDQVLVTTLLDACQFPLSLFSDLYHLRWGIEENYKQMKCRIEMENFTGKSVESVYQDFHARVLALNLTAIVAHPVHEIVQDDTRTWKHGYQINFTAALSAMKDTLVLLLQRERPHHLLRKIMQRFRRNIEPVRPNRNYPRNKVSRDRPTYYNCYKPPA